MTKIWQRYFFKEIIKSFFFFLIVFYGLYVIIDYSSKSSNFNYGHSHFKILDIAVFYLFDFIEKAEVLVPFGLLIATIKTLTNLNLHNELIALMTSGIQLKKLLRPFLITSIFMVGLMYANTQFFMPYAMQSMNHMDQKHRAKKNKGLENVAVQNLILKDKSTVIFQSYDTQDKSLGNVYWIRSIDDMYRIKNLYPYHEVPKGASVEHLKRNSDGNMYIADIHDVLLFPEMRFHKRDLFQSIIDPEDESLTDLWKKVPQTISSEKESQITSVFYNKMIMPWLCLLAVIGPIPFCVKFSRNIPLFLIYATSIFGLIALYLVTDATLVLGKRQILEPWLAVLFPFFFCSFFISYKFVRLH